MDAREKALKKAIELLVDYYMKEAGTYVSLHGFNDTILVLKGVSIEINADLEAITTKQQKFTVDKNLAKGFMIESVCYPAYMVLAYAGLNRTTYTAPTAVQISPRILSRRHEANLPNDCKAVINVCVALGDKLLPHGFTDEVHKVASDSIEDFVKKMVESPEFASWKAAVNQKISSNLEKAEDIMVNTLDPIARLLAKNNPVQYAQYLSLRKISLPGGHTVSLKGKILDSGSKMALRGVLATILRTAFPDGTKATGADAVHYTKVSTKKGTLQLKSLPAGTYTITVVKAGYAVQTITFYVNEHEMTKFEILLVKL